MGKVFIYEPITEAYGNQIIAQIEKEKTSLDVHIDSPGGNVYKGFAIYNALQRKRDILSTYVDGLAYSAASWIALSANPGKRFMSKASQFGIHEALNFAGGNKAELKDQIKNLEKIDQIQVEIYEAATGLKRERITSLMKKGQPLSHEEAQEFGFELYQADKIAALFNINEMTKLEELLNHFKGTDKIPEVEAASKEKVEAEHKEAVTPAEALSANFTAKADFLEFKATTQPFMEAIIEYIEKQPKEDEIKEMVKAEAKLQMTALLDTINTDGKVPTKEEQFPEAKQEPQTFEPLTLKKNTFELINEKK